MTETTNDAPADYEPWYEMFSRQVRNMAPPDFPQIVCLCGSTRFGKEYAEANKRLTLQGYIVLSVGMLGHAEGIDMEGPVKKSLDQLHLRKIDLADTIFVLNVGGYIGQSTSREIAHAIKRGKNVLYLECPKENRQ